MATQGGTGGGTPPRGADRPHPQGRAVAPTPAPRTAPVPTATKTSGQAGQRPAAPRLSTGGRPAGRPPRRSVVATAVVPPQAVAGRALILVVAIMGFLACLSFGVLTLVAEAARGWQLDVSREVTIQVKPIDGVAIEGELQKAMALARATAGVRSVRLLSDRDSAALLEPWLGAGIDLSGLPVPRLVVLDLADPAGADLPGLRRALEAQTRGALLDDHSVWAARLRTMAGTMVVAGFVVLFLVLAAMVLSVVFATRAAMAGNRDVIEVLHFVGAEDGFIAREFQRHFLLLGFKGGLGGGLAAMLAFALADWVTRSSQGSAVGDQANALFGGFSVGLLGYLGVAGIIALVAILTAVTSRWTVRSYLAQID